MVKSDAHMARIRQRLLDEKAGIKKGEEKRKEREMKKIGKQVQLEKLKERRERGRDEVEKVKGMKRSKPIFRSQTVRVADCCGNLTERQNIDEPSDAFDVTLDEDGDDKRDKKRSKSGSGSSKVSRKARDQKYGFGGKVGRRAKQNTRESTEKIFGDAPGRKGKGGFGGGGKKAKGGPAKRPGKGKRMAMKSRK
jgi:rRNA-processing protein EBP2